MKIRNFKSKFDCTCYSGMKKIVKIFVKYNLEIAMILMGTLYFLRFENAKDKTKTWKRLES